MSRIRTVKPEYFTHPAVQACSIPARLLLISMWTQADDEGRLFDLPSRIRGEAFGENDDVDAARLLDELAEQGRIIRYVVSGRRLIQVHDFKVHQRMSHPTPSKLPAPRRRGRPEDSRPTPGKHRESSRNSPGGVPEDSRPELEQGTGNREQGSKTVAVRQHSGGLREKSVRPRDEAWEGFVEATATAADELSKTRREQLNGMLRSLRDRPGMRDVSRADQGAEIRRRAANHWTVPTPEYLVGHWAELGAARPVKGGRQAPADRMFSEVKEEIADATARSEGARGHARRSLPSA